MDVTNREKKPLRGIIGRIAAVFGCTLLFAVLLLYGAMLILTHGPSPSLKELFVMTVKESSAGGFLADMCLGQEEIAEILSMKENGAGSAFQTGKIDTSLIHVPAAETDKNKERKPSQPQRTDPLDGIERVEIKGKMYHGTMLIVRDPSRVALGTPQRYGTDVSGITLREMLQNEDAVCGINGGGFYDENGTGDGGVPEGYIIKNGEVLWDVEGEYSVVGFDKNHVLHVGTLTLDEALEKEICDACCFGPALILNGVPCNAGGELYSGCNPRTAIGQRADGSVLLLIIEGRQLGSLGATMDDLVEIFRAYGAVNATNLDGGGSTLMFYDGEPVNTAASIYGERSIASGFVVKK